MYISVGDVIVDVALVDVAQQQTVVVSTNDVTSSFIIDAAIASAFFINALSISSPQNNFKFHNRPYSRTVKQEFPLLMVTRMCCRFTVVRCLKAKKFENIVCTINAPFPLSRMQLESNAILILIENNDISCHTLPTLFSIRLILVSQLFCILLHLRDRREFFKQFKTFASAPRTEEDAEQCYMSVRRMENNTRRM